MIARHSGFSWLSNELLGEQMNSDYKAWRDEFDANMKRLQNTIWSVYHHSNFKPETVAQMHMLTQLIEKLAREGKNESK